MTISIRSWKTMGESSLLLFQKICVKFTNKGRAIKEQQIRIWKKILES